MALALAHTGQPALYEECPAELVLHAKGLTRTEEATAQLYAQCMAALSATGRLSEKVTTCDRYRLPNPSRVLTRAFDWVDKMATQFSTCETNLAVRRK